MLKHKLILAICLLLSACGKDQSTSFVFTSEAPPQAPYIKFPSTEPSLTVHTSNVRIEGCFNSTCTVVPRMTFQTSNEGRLSQGNGTFTFEAFLSAGETRQFSFSVANARGDVSPETSITLAYEPSVELIPHGILLTGGASGSGLIQGGWKLNFLTSLSSLLETGVQDNGLVLTAGGLNPQ